uniref:Wall-associated receptor kinase galacturonan-binding domain-containing protein n=2 Tax=Aegilops tauschii subsp. strangulata TaxID=200361 RepID=A0A453GVS6_AEGTS
AVVAMLTSPLLAGAEVSPAEAQGMPDCDITCGNMSVPYPFGMGPARCYWPGFNLTCNTGQQPAKLLLVLSDPDFGMDSNFHVTEISLRTNTVRILRTNAIMPISSGRSSTVFFFGNYSEAPYSLSTGNEFILSGCNLYVMLIGDDTEDVISGCASFCPSNISETFFGTVLQRANRGRYCNGMGCCQANIPMSSNGLPTSLMVVNRNRDQELTSQPAYTLIAEEGWFDQRRLSKEIAGREKYEIAKVQVPQVLQWEVIQDLPRPDDMTAHPGCPVEVARKLCKSKNSYCKRGSRGYLCQFMDGYDKPGSNPYLPDEG